MAVIPEQFDPSAFPDVDLDAWRERVRGELDGEAPESLASVDADGIPIGPLHVEGDALAVPPRAASGWDLRREHLDPEREAILADLEGGASSLLLHVADPRALAELLDGVHLEMITIALEAGGRAPEVAEALIALWRERGIEGAQARGWLNFRTTDAEAAARSIAEHGARYPAMNCLLSDASAAPTPVTAVGAAIAGGLSWLRALRTRGVAADEAARRLVFRLPCSSRFFTGIAAVRALRLLWAQALHHAEIEGRPAVVELRPTELEGADPAKRMLHATVVAFAGALAGADAITGRAFDDGRLAARLDRNTQHVLHDEAGLGEIVDPAAGSGYLEYLTDAIARRAWEHARSVEAAP